MTDDFETQDQAVRDMFGKRLQELREHAGISRPDLGERVGRTGQQVAALEQGRTGTSILIAGRIANELGVRMVDLFDLDDQPALNAHKRDILRKMIREIRHDDPQTLRLIARLAEVTHDELEDGS